MNRGQPPRGATWMLRLLLPRADREFVLGDLEEQHSMRCDRRGRRNAAMWYWIDAVRSVWSLMTEPDLVTRTNGWRDGMTNLVRDIQHSARSLWRSKSFSCVVIVTMALCIGANTAVLSALYSLAGKPLPVEDPERLVQLFNLRSGTSGHLGSQSSWNQYLDLRERSNLFVGGAIVRTVTELVGPDASVRRVKVQKVSAEFFDLMGAQPVLGRFFLPEEVHPAAPSDVLVLSQTTWEDQYDADPAVIGQQIPYRGNFGGENRHYTIIGVAPSNMEAFDDQAIYFTPFTFFTDREGDPTVARYSGGGDLWLRLKDGVSREAALEEIRTIEGRWYEEIASPLAKRNGRVFDRFAFDQPHPLEGSLYLLQGGAMMLLLMGCFNVMTLFVSRAGEKSHELSIRSALGAGQRALRRLMLAESAWLLASAVGTGAILAWGGTHVINLNLEVLSPTTMPVELDWTIVAVTAGGAVAITGLMGLLPLEILRRAGLLQRVDSSQRTSSPGGFSAKLRHAMVVGQVAVAFVLLIGAGLLFRSLSRFCP